MSAAGERTVAIVGAGFSGSVLAIQLVRNARRPLRIRLIERNSEFGPGLAYGTVTRDHFLNVRARAMSAFPDESDHFVRWLAARAGKQELRTWGVHGDPDAFMPRAIYGAYIRSLLDDAERAGSDRAKIECVRGEAVSLEPRGLKVGLMLGSGESIHADRVVLAMGNPPPLDPLPLGHPFMSSKRYRSDPWRPSAVSGLRENASVLLVGTNLTMIDVVVSLVAEGHRGPIHAISRHGLLPLPYASAGTSQYAAARPWPVGSLRRLFRSIREGTCAPVAPRSHDWRAVVDSLRPHAGELWSALGPEDQRRFLRHVRSYWDIHRHRAVPENLRLVARLLKAGRLHVHAGRITNIQEGQLTCRATVERRNGGPALLLNAERIINCSGPDRDYRPERYPLVASLAAQGLCRPGPAGFGLHATREGALIDRRGCASTTVYGLGPVLKAALWESTAVPEIRLQALRLAERFVSELEVG